MKFVDKIAQRGARSLFYTFEFFPPKTDQVKTHSSSSELRMSMC